MSGHYILRDKLPTEVDVLEYWRWRQENKHKDPYRIARDELADGRVVSTVFLGCNVSEYRVDQPPIWFETAVIKPDGVHEDETRYSTYDEAIAGHAETLKRVNEANAT